MYPRILKSVLIPVYILVLIPAHLNANVYTDLHVSVYTGLNASVSTDLNVRSGLCHVSNITKSPRVELYAGK